MRINPGLQVLSLVEGVIQIGTGQRARWLTGLSTAEKNFVLSLCGNGLPAAVPPDGELAGSGPDERRRSEILSVLAPVLVDAPAPRPPKAPNGGHWPGARLAPDVRQWSAAYQLDATEVLARRAGAKVALYGCGRTGQLLAQILAGAGVGGLLLIDPGTLEAQDLGAGALGRDAVGATRAGATARSLQPNHPNLVVAETGRRGPDSEPLDVAVVIAGGRLPALDSLARDHALLPVLFNDSGVNLGPLHLPGLTMCGQCVWEQCDPTLRLLELSDGEAHGPALRPESSLAALAAGLAAMQVLMVLDRINIPSSAGSMMVCDLPTGSVSALPARPRSRCSCLQPPAA